MTNKSAAPCGHSWRSGTIARRLRGVLWPTMFIDCRCSECEATWTERYEFDFAVPIDGRPWEQQEAQGTT